MDDDAYTTDNTERYDIYAVHAPATQSHPEGTGSTRNFHAGQPVLHSGALLREARAAVVLAHGRGSSAEDILTLADELGHADLAYFAPQAAGGTWYPYSFLMPIAQNEPFLSAALATLDTLLASLVADGMPAERIVLAGFSQGACLASEYTARHARRYGGLIAFSGGLIGPANTPRDYPGTLEGTPVFLGCSDVDPHIPRGRVDETAEVLRRLGASVTERIYPRMPHTINTDELTFARQMLAELASAQ